MVNVVLYRTAERRVEYRQTEEEGCGLHCLVPSYINDTQCSAGKIPFVIPFVLQANRLISLPVRVRACVRECVCVGVCVWMCVCFPLFSHLSVKVSIDHYLGLCSIHTNGLHYLLINTDGWR